MFTGQFVEYGLLDNQRKYVLLANNILIRK